MEQITLLVRDERKARSLLDLLTSLDFVSVLAVKEVDESIADWVEGPARVEDFYALREQARRKEALRQLEELAAQIQARNADINAEEVEQLADEITRETIQRMERDGKITFQS